MTFLYLANRTRSVSGHPHVSFTSAARVLHANMHTTFGFMTTDVSTNADASDNYPAPGKRPLSSTAPTILEHPDGSFYLALGGSGGSKIFGSVAYVILGADAVLATALRDDDDWIDISKAVEAPRAHDQLFPLHVEMDSTFDQDSVDQLQARQHNVTG